MSDPHAGEGFDTRLAKIYDDSQENGVAVIRDIEGVAGGGLPAGRCLT